ncbi:hypothetical protein DFP73DRAFT_616350 [Morchella snyderi]|nr:hypothetical protein DFP73DRAFT_616350 [Morchella snyderi]
MLHSPEALFKVSSVIHYIYPPVLFLCFFVMQGITVCTMKNLKAPNKIVRRNLILGIQAFVIITYVAEAILLLARSLVQKGWYSPEDHVVYVLSAILAWGAIELALLDSVNTVWYPYYGCWVLSLVTEICLIILPNYYNVPDNAFKRAKSIIQAIRITILILLPAVFWGFQIYDNRKEAGNDEESAGLLTGNNGSRLYGTASPECVDETVETREAKARMLKKIEESGNWWIYAKSFAIFWPYVWPSKDGWLKISMALVGICLLIERGLNVMVPYQLGVVTNALARGNGSIPWVQVSLYVMYRWLDSGSGISALQRYLWMPIDQYAYRSITTAAYNHVMSLSHDFHTNKKTGDLYSSVNQGRSVNGFIESVLFSVLPMLADLCVAFVYFYIAFNSYMALIVAVVSMVYLWVTARLGARKNQMRRDFNAASRKEASIMWETMSSWTTVSYFNRVPYEQDRYSEAIRNYQRAERKWDIGLRVLNVAQSLIFTVGLLAASFLAIYMVTMGQRPVGSFVTLLSYWAQLSSPLAYFANFYRRIQTQMLDAERLLELFQTKPTVVDKPGAMDLKLISGEIEFENVKFSYDPRKPAINGINFKAPGGSTIALVGETGGGKTTCLKLLFRFFDVESGAIKIDGQDIKDVTLWSLRDNMGVVPQDPELFNDTIMNNIRYANFDATDEQVFAACRAASIHDKIESFPDGYLSKVGERGVKLSGGELQRVAIARAILKDPKIILLDEATSMVDMETERQIQSAFKELSVGRTMFVVAHRLSTIMNANLIIVIQDGGILEKGSHDELIELKGKYYHLWSKQMKNEGPKSGADLNDMAMVNDLSPKSREEKLRTALQKTGARFHTADPCLEDNKMDGTSSSSGIFMKTDKKVTVGESVSTQASVRSNGRPNVSFATQDSPSLGRSVDSQYRPQNLFRAMSPAHSTLKNPDVPKQPESQLSFASRSVTPKLSSSLKPDAREFIPNEVVPRDIPQEYDSIPQQVQVGFTPKDSFPINDKNFTGDTTTSVSVVGNEDPRSERTSNTNQEFEAHEEEDQGVMVQNVEDRIDEALKIAEEKMKELEGRDKEETYIKIPIASSKHEIHEEDGQDEQPTSSLMETQPDSELKKKRRRSRRRSNKPKSLVDTSMEDQDAGGVIVTGYPEPIPITTLPSDTSNMPKMVSVSPRPVNDGGLSNVIGGDLNSTASGLEKKPKRRFRTRHPAKPQSPKAETENQEPGPHRGPTLSNEVSSRQFKGKGRASSFIDGDYRSITREDTYPPPRDGVQSSIHSNQPEQSASNNGTIPKGPGRRKTWGRYYGPKSTNNWRKPDSEGSGDGLQGTYRKYSNESPGA